MLPRRIQKQKNRTERWKSTAHRDFVRGHACSMCGKTAGVQFAHVRIGSDAGMGRKPSDYFGVSLCGDCHTGDQHTMGEASFWHLYESRHGQSVQQLMDEFNAASPKSGEIRRIKAERAGG
jgi:hypothetical protein